MQCISPKRRDWDHWHDFIWHFYFGLLTLRSQIKIYPPRVNSTFLMPKHFTSNSIKAYINNFCCHFTDTLNWLDVSIRSWRPSNFFNRIWSIQHLNVNDCEVQVEHWELLMLWPAIFYWLLQWLLLIIRDGKVMTYRINFKS